MKEGDKVLCPSLTFSATANCIRYCNGEVVFVDTDPNTYLIDLNKVAVKVIDEYPFQGIFLVHRYIN